MMKIPPAKDFGGHTDIPKNITRETWRPAHEQRRLRRLPSARPGSDAHDPGAVRQVRTPAPTPGCAASPSGQSGEMMTNRIAGQLGGVPYKYFGDWTDRVAKGELPKNKPPRPSGVERNLVVTTWDWSTPDKYLHDLISSDRRKPTVNAGGPLYGAPEYSTDNDADPRSEDPQGVVLQDAGGRSEHAGLARTGPRRRDQADDAVGLLGRRDPVGHQGEPAQRHVRRQGPGLARRDRARHGQSGLVQEGLGASVRQGVPDRPLAASGRRCSIPRRRSTRSSTPASAPIIRSSATTPTTRCGCPAPGRWRAGSTPRCWTRPATREKAVGWFPFVLDINGNGKLDEFTEPGKPEEGKDTRFNPGSGPYAVMPHPTDGSIWYTSGVFGGTAGLPALRSEDQAQRVLRSCRRKRSACAAATSARTACCTARAPPAI